MRSRRELDVGWWEQLEVDAERIVRENAVAPHLQHVVRTMSPRARAVLLAQRGIDVEALSVEEQHRALASAPELLMTYALVAEFAVGKRYAAITSVAEKELDREELASCGVPAAEAARYDRMALLLLLHARSPDHLRAVFCLDRIEQQGSAALVLVERPAATPRRDVFTAVNINAIVASYEAREQTPRESYCETVMFGPAGERQVFIKRDLQPAFASRGRRNVFGFRREWIIMRFDADLQRVRIGSTSPRTPAELANEIASTAFGSPVAYVNESAVTPAHIVHGFLEALVNEPDGLPLVELHLRSCGLDTEPALALCRRAGSESLARPLMQFAGVFGNPLEAIETIESIRVERFGKRIRIKFELVEHDHRDREGFIVRYGDQLLDLAERQAFEDLIARRYGIKVLSTEKRHAKA